MKIDPLKRLTKQRARLSSRPTLNTLCTMDIFSLICLLSFVPSTGCWDRMPLTSAKGSGSLWPKTSTLFWLSSYFLLDAALVMWWLMKLQFRLGETHCCHGCSSSFRVVGQCQWNVPCWDPVGRTCYLELTVEDESIVWGSCVIVLLEAACTTLTVEQFPEA